LLLSQPTSFGIRWDERRLHVPTMQMTFAEVAALQGHLEDSLPDESLDWYPELEAVVGKIQAVEVPYVECEICGVTFVARSHNLVGCVSHYKFCSPRCKEEGRKQNQAKAAERRRNSI
jgi:hypothetical protein